MNLATGCSGIGAPDLAARELGWRHVFACENAAFPRAVLEHRFGYGAPDGPRYKAIGNSWAYPVGLWVMRRMGEEDRRTHGEGAA